VLSIGFSPSGVSSSYVVVFAAVAGTELDCVPVGDEDDIERSPIELDVGVELKAIARTAIQTKRTESIMNAG